MVLPYIFTVFSHKCCFHCISCLIRSSAAHCNIDDIEVWLPAVKCTNVSFLTFFLFLIFLSMMLPSCPSFFPLLPSIPHINPFHILPPLLLFLSFMLPSFLFFHLYIFLDYFSISIILLSVLLLPFLSVPSRPPVLHNVFLFFLFLMHFPVFASVFLFLCSSFCLFAVILFFFFFLSCSFFFSFVSLFFVTPSLHSLFLVFSSPCFLISLAFLLPFFYSHC